MLGTRMLVYLRNMLSDQIEKMTNKKYNISGIQVTNRCSQQVHCNHQ